MCRRTASPGGSQAPVRPAEAVDVALSTVDLDELRAHPLRWRGTPLRVTVQLGTEREPWAPGLTRFHQGRFRAFEAWSDTARLWHAGAWADPLPGLYVRRDAPAAAALAGAGEYGRLELELVLRAISGGEIWAEVTAARRLPRSVGEGTLIHAGRALDLLADGRPAAAAEEYERALAAPLPDGHREALEEERARALELAEAALED